MTEIDFANPPTPYGHPLRMIDRVDSLDLASGKLVARKAVSRNEPMLQGHFPGHLILPGILQIESLAQTASLLLKLAEGKDVMLRTFIADSRIKHMRPVVPGDMMTLEAQLVTRKDPFYTFRVRVLVDNEEASKGQIVLQWLNSLRPSALGESV